MEYSTVLFKLKKIDKLNLKKKVFLLIWFKKK